MRFRLRAVKCGALEPSGQEQPATVEEQAAVCTFEPVYRAWRPRLLDMTRELVRVSKDTEDEFLVLGAKLQEFAKECLDNSSYASSITKMIEGESGFDLHAFKGLFEHSYGKVESCVAAISGGIDGMGGLLSHLNAILALQEFLKKLTRSISTFGTLMKIETARAGEDEFTIMTSIVDSLAEEIERDNSEIASSAKAAQASLIAAQRKMEAEMERFRKKLERAKEQIYSILQSIDAMVSTAGSLCRRIEDRTGKISPEVNSIVSSLQYHDICRQQIEHVSEVISAVAAKSAGLDTMDQAGKASFHHWASEALTIQTAQLEHVTDEAVEAARGITAHLSGIADLAAAQSEDAGTVLDGGGSGSNGIQKIIAALESLSLLLGESSAMTVDMLNAVGEVNNHIKQMSGQVGNIEAISENINLLALNTIIKVSRTGDSGRGLEVLAGEIRKLSIRAKSEIAKGSDTITSILSASSGFETSLTEGLNRELLATNDVLQQTNRSAQELLQANEKIENALARMASTTKDLKTAITHLVSSIRFDTLIKSRLGMIIDGLRELLTEMTGHAPVVSAETVLASAQDMHMLTQRYTMRSERDVHKAALGVLKKGNGGQSAEVEGSLGGNVELF